VADSSVGAHRSSAVDDPWSPPPAFHVPRERPKVRVKADLLPAISVVSAVFMLVFPLAGLWMLLAPPQRMRVFGDDRLIPLELESWHRFDDLAIYGLLSLGFGIVIGVVTWLMRERRGPVILIAAVLGAGLVGWMGTILGPGFAAGRYAITTPPALGDVIEKAPQLESSWVLLAAPLAAVFVYGMLAAWNSRDDLGRRLG
jgi:hypothetical protein